MSVKSYTAWIFQGSKTYDIDNYLLNYKKIYWNTPKLKRLIKIGDFVFLWRSLKASKDRMYGVIASGKVIEEPVLEENVSHPEFLGPEFWNENIDNFGTDIYKTGILITDVRLTSEDGMLLADNLKKVDTLSNMSILKQPVGSVFGITTEELTELNKQWWGIKFIVPEIENNTEHIEDNFEEGIEEGKVKLVTHKSYERDPRIIKKKKAQILALKGKLECEVCEFNFYEVYGDHGKDFIECHHKKPISEITPGMKTTLDDLALVCSNCHRMIHRNGLKTIEEIKSILS